MRSNILKQKFRSKEVALGAWCSIGSPYSAELLGHGGFDTVVVDLQHGMLYLEQAMAMLAALSATPAMPMVRVSDNQFFEVNKLLDAGAYGVICPMIDGVEDARRFVSACRYPPLGKRSYGPTRGFLYGGPDYFSGANNEILTLAMIETPQGLRDVDQIAAVDGIDGLFVGPSDLSLALGLEPGVDWRSGPLADAIDRILASARRHGKMTGIFCTTVPFAIDMKNKGFDYINLGNDASFLRTSAQAWVGAVKGTEAGVPGKPTGY